MQALKKIYHTTSEEETKAFGKTLAKSLTNKSPVCFYGDLGAGKTTLIKAIISEINPAIDETNVISPTFNYVHEYPAIIPIFHFDLYRLNNEVDFFRLGLEEHFSEGICLIEWPERIKKILPDNQLAISLQITGPDTRSICCG